MKKLFLGLIATMMFCFAGNAQTSVYSKSSMVVLVGQAKKEYTKGVSYQDWVTKQIGNQSKPSPQEEKFLKEIYGFLSTGAKSDVIYKNYDGNSLVELVKLEQNGGLTAIGGTNARCGWWCQFMFDIIKFAIELLVDMP
ncbi:hypothetical protein [Flavobacterium sp.]|uniref:hypothetical protein n=1 Tax=Flavobacterium sp. TaxID=239 RepID=UPI00286B3949|nr:hypothetical protein [Flavobacterium sp.]